MSVDSSVANNRSLTMRKLKVMLIKLFATPSKARVNKAIRNYNNFGIKTNWAWQGASK